MFPQAKKPFTIKGENKTAEDTASIDMEQESSSSSGSLVITPPAKEDFLENYVALSHLFQLCPASLVASCRQVNKLWYEASLITWRTKFPITITHDTQLNAYHLLCNNPVNQFSAKPYRNIRFRNFNFGFNSEQFGEFWEGVGRNVTTLNLHRCDFSSIEEFRKIIYKSCPLLKNLKIDFNYLFAIRNQNVSDRDYNALDYIEPFYGENRHLRCLDITKPAWIEMLPVSWTELFSHFPLLTSFNVSEIEEVGFEMLMDAITVLRTNEETMLPFTRFGFNPKFIVSSDPVSKRNWAIIDELHLPLTECVIQVDAKLEQPFLTNTLNFLAASLNTIILTQGTDKTNEIPTWFHGFPFEIQLDKLTTLESQDGLIQNPSFLKYTPRLETFDCQQKISDSIVGRFDTNTYIDELTGFQLVRLTSLKLGFQLGGNDVQHLCQWMSNINKLETYLNDRQFGMVCESWKGLRSLVALGGDLTVEGVTEMKAVKEAKEIGTVIILPKIANLECLEVLTLRSLWKNELTNESICYLFLHLPSLQRILGGNFLVKRGDVDLVSYKRAVTDNNLENWVADNMRAQV